MLLFPPIPGWNSLHPMFIHFPIVLLLLCPLFVLISAAMAPPKGRPYMISALIILLLGTGSLFLAAATGEATAATVAGHGGPVEAVLKSHAELAEETKIVCLVLSAIMVGIVALPRFLQREETRLTTTLVPLSFLVLYCVGILFLVSTAQAGTRLVHEFGVHAIIPAGNGQSGASSGTAGSAQMDEGN